DGLDDGEEEEEDGGGGGHARPRVAEVVVRQHGAVAVPAPAAVLPHAAVHLAVAVVHGLRRRAQVRVERRRLVHVPPGEHPGAVQRLRVAPPVGERRHEERVARHPLHLPPPPALLVRHQVGEHGAVRVVLRRRDLHHAAAPVERDVHEAARRRLGPERHPGVLQLRRRRHLPWHPLVDRLRQPLVPERLVLLLLLAGGAAAAVARPLLRWQEPVVVEVEEVEDLAVGRPRCGGVLRGVHGEVLGEEACDEVVAAEAAGGDVVEALDDEEGELVLEEEEVVVHVLHRPRGVDERVGGAVLALEEELDDEAAVEEEHLGELPRRERDGLGVAAARRGLELAGGAGVGGERRVAAGVVAGEEVAEVAPLVLLHGAEAGGAAVEGADGDHLGLVEVAVAAAHRAGDAEDGERLALVRLPRQRLHPPLHARRHLLRLGV
ncbi:hypothetical protein EE612_045636, partial [Oryza sativa]